MHFLTQLLEVSNWIAALLKQVLNSRLSGLIKSYIVCVLIHILLNDVEIRYSLGFCLFREMFILRKPMMRSSTINE
jgi:hypothetical protein